MPGRPRGYSDALAELICARLAEGQSLVAICKRDDMPSRMSVHRWLRTREGFRERYARARAGQGMSFNGRPSTYSEPMAEAICMALVEGESLTAICTREGLTSLRTVFRWLKQRPEFREQYVLARKVQADIMAEEIVAISDAAEDVQRAKLQIDARKWMAARLAPKTYGDKVTLSGDEANPLKLEVTDGARERLARLVAGQLAGGGEDEGAG